jgi:hypothetical protein
MPPKVRDTTSGADAASVLPVELGGRVAVLGRPRTLVPSSRARLSTALLAGLLASVAAAVTSLPWLPAMGTGVHGLLMALVVTLPVVLLVELGALAAGRFPRVQGTFDRLTLTLQLQAWTVFMVLGAGLFCANRYLTDDLFGRQTLVANALALALAVTAARAMGRWSRRRALSSSALPRQRAVTALLVATIALVLQVGGNAAFPPGYPAIDLSLQLGALVGWTVALHLAVCNLRPRAMRRAAILAAAFCLVMAGQWTLGNQVFRPISAQARRTLSWRSLELARSLLDADRDGVSALLGGGDCDDGDPRVRPVSLEGRDCLGWIPKPSIAPPARGAPLVAPRDQGPRLLVLVTIDSFRCGLGLREAPPLRDGCPHLTALGHAGHLRSDLRTPTHTVLALNNMFLGPDRPPLISVPDLLRQVGFHSHAISTVTPVTRTSALGALFDDVDDSLVAVAKSATASTVEAGTDRALRWLARVETAPGRHFLWLHHYDTHLPLLARPGSMLVGRRIPTYAAELRRTDDQILRLRQALERSPAAAETLLMVTADHGEDLGELGYQAHGMSLRETTVRVPFIAWSPGKDSRRFVPGQVPAAPSELGPFVASVLGGPAFEPATAVTFATDNRSYPQIGIHHDGWKLVHHLLSNYDELYQLATDPEERNNLAQERPDLVQSLGRLLGQRVVTDQWLYDLVSRVAKRASGGGLLQEEDHRQAVEARVR